MIEPRALEAALSAEGQQTLPEFSIYVLESSTQRVGEDLAFWDWTYQKDEHQLD